jgi:hypothetical protein
MFISFLKPTFHYSVISGFRREVDENCTLIGYYEASSVNFLPTFRDKLSVPSSGVNKKEERSSYLLRGGSL